MAIYLAIYTYTAICTLSSVAVYPVTDRRS
jgi:hypothetical protein